MRAHAGRRPEVRRQPERPAPQGGWRHVATVCVLVVISGCTHQVQTVSYNPRPPKPPKSNVTATMMRQVENAIDAGDGDIAIRNLRKKIEADPSNLEARLELAGRYEKRGLPEIAIEHYRLAAERFPDSPRVPVRLAQAFRSDGLLHEAAETIERFLASHPPKGPELPSWLGILRDEMGELAAAETAHRAALTLDDGDAALHNNLGYNLLLQAKQGQAAEEFRRALALEPRSQIARNNLGMALASNPREAVSNWQTGSDAASAHNNLAAVMIEQGRYEEARKELSVALGYRRDHPAALRNLQLLSELDGKSLTIPAGRSGRAARQESGWMKFARGVWNEIAGSGEEAPAPGKF